MYLCICVSMYRCIYVSMYLCIYVSMYICIYVAMYLCMCVCMYVCMYVSMYLCIYVYMYLCMYVCMYIYIYIYTYIHTYICASLFEWHTGTYLGMWRNEVSGETVQGPGNDHVLAYMSSNLKQTCMHGCCGLTGVCEKTYSGLEDRRKISFQRTKSGAGLQFLLLDCRARACTKGVFSHRHRYHYRPVLNLHRGIDWHSCSIDMYVCFWWQMLEFERTIRPISLLTLPLILRLLDSKFPGNAPWAWEFHPLELRLGLSQTLRNP